MKNAIKCMLLCAGALTLMPAVNAQTVSHTTSVHTTKTTTHVSTRTGVRHRAHRVRHVAHRRSRHGISSQTTSTTTTTATRTDRTDTAFVPERQYREGPQYQERTLTEQDRVYAGQDGRYYCRRPDGTTGLIVGAAAGGLLGNVIAKGNSATLGTILGASAGALAGRAVEQQTVHCR